MTHDEMIAVIEHHRNGGTVEVRSRCRPGGWCVASVPNWDFSRYEYRIKKEPVVMWGIVWHDGSVCPQFFDEREEAEENAKGMYPGRVIKLVEAGA